MNSAEKIAKAVLADYEKFAAPLLADQKRWERILAPYATDISRAARQMEEQHRELEKSLKAVMPDFSRMIAAMEEERKRFPDRVRTLAKHGWYIPPGLTPRIVEELTEALTGGRAAEVEVAMIEY